MTTWEGYSLRLLCPFLGTAQVISTSDGRAITTNGVNWQIQIATQRPDSIWGSFSKQAPRDYFRFGIWSKREGLGRIPLNPLLDVTQMLRASNELVTILDQAHDKLPFPPADELELWLLDKDEGMPLALLATTPDNRRLNNETPPRWATATLADANFESPRLAGADLGKNSRRGVSPHLAYLENLVRERSGSALWFRRDAGAAAEPLDRIPGKRFPGCCCGKTGPIPGHGTLSQIIWTGKRLDC